MADMDPLLAYLLATGGPKNMTPDNAMTADAQNQLLNMNLQNGIQPATPLPNMRTQRHVVMPAPGPTAPLVQTNQAVNQQRVPTTEKDQYDAMLNDFNNKVKEGILQQQGGVSKLEAMRNQAAQVPTQVDLSPLAAYIDSIVPGSKLSSGYTAPESGSQKQHRLMSYEEAIQKARLGISDKEIEAMKVSLQNSLFSKMQKNQTQDARQERQELGLHAQLMNKLDSNKTLQQRLVQSQNLDNALAQVENTQNLTPQQILEVQQAIRSNLGIKGTSGVEERANTYYNSLGLKGASLQQYLTGDPVTLSRDSKLMQHIRDMAKIERQKIQEQANRTIDSVSVGLGSVYKRRPDLKADFENKIQSLKGQFEQPAPATGAATSPNDPMARLEELRRKARGE